MEEAHATHKAHTSGWLAVMLDIAGRLRRRSGKATRGLVVTPWSGRAPSGWSA